MRKFIKDAWLSLIRKKVGSPSFLQVSGILNSNVRFGTGTSYVHAMIIFS